MNVDKGVLESFNEKEVSIFSLMLREPSVSNYENRPSREENFSESMPAFLYKLIVAVVSKVSDLLSLLFLLFDVYDF